MITIITDSCSDLSPELIDRFQIKVIPLTVYLNDQAYLDGVNISRDELFAAAEKNGQLPKTAAPSIAQFQQMFAQSSDEIIYTGISSKLSATFQSAQLAKETFKDKDIRIIDSKNLSTGIGLLVTRAAEMRDENYSLDEIEEAMIYNVNRTHVSFVIDTLDYLFMGGRCSSMEHLVGSILRIRPVIEVREDGTLGVREKIGGSRRRALNSMLADFKNHLPTLDHHRVFVTHTGCDSDAEYLVGEIKKLTQLDEIQTTYAGATVSSHCGRNTIGILYMAD